MQSRNTKRKFFIKSLMSGVILTCSTALADHPDSVQVAELDGFPVFEQTDSDDFVAWTDEIFGSGILDAKQNVAQKSDAHEIQEHAAVQLGALPSYFGEQTRIAQKSDGIVVSSEIDTARQTPATVVKTPAKIKRVESYSLNVDPIDHSNRIAQRPNDTNAKSSAGRNSLMDGDISYRTPEVVGGRLELPAIAAASTSIENIGNGRVPAGFRSDEGSPIMALPEQGIERDASWSWTTKAWDAPNTFSHPLYFEDRMLERHGHERCPHLTPMIAGMRFFTTVPMLPYLATIDHPCDCDYTLGYYRSGSCAPAYLQRPPYERRAVVAEAAAVTGVIVAFP